MKHTRSVPGKFYSTNKWAIIEPGSTDTNVTHRKDASGNVLTFDTRKHVRDFLKLEREQRSAAA